MCQEPSIVKTLRKAVNDAQYADTCYRAAKERRKEHRDNLRVALTAAVKSDPSLYEYGWIWHWCMDLDVPGWREACFLDHKEGICDS